MKLLRSARPYFYLLLSLLLGPLGQVSAEGTSSGVDMRSLESVQREARITEQLYAKHVNNVYTVQILDRVTESKVGHGTGFFLDTMPLMITNYHVISEHLNDPDKYQLRVQLRKGHFLPVQVLAFDIIHDLALLHIDLTGVSELNIASIGAGLALSHGQSMKGQPLYALGNPHGIGLTIVPGVYNGQVEQSLVELIHFTGPINPGMSGGPAINARGRVVGVNVATSGNSIGFLVPVTYVKQLVEKYRDNPQVLVDPSTEVPLEKQALGESIQEASVEKNEEKDESPFSAYEKSVSIEGHHQLQAYQERLLTELLSNPLPTKKLYNRPVVKELGDAFACSGSSAKQDTEEEVYFTRYLRECYSQGNIYLNSDFSTGQIHYSFKIYTDPLRSLAMSTILEGHLEGFADNYTDEEHVTKYECIDTYTEHQSLKEKGEVDQFRTVYCTRQYQHYIGLGDVLFIAVQVPKAHQDKSEIEVFVAEYALAGVSSKMANKFLERFLEALQWQ